MTDYCEIVETGGVITSSCPAVDIVVVALATGSGTSSTHPGITQQLQISTAAGTSTVTIDAYALLTSSGASTSTVTGSTVTNELAEEDWPTIAFSSLFVEMDQLAASAAAATSSILHASATALLASTAAGTSTATANTASTMLLNSAAAGTSFVVTGLYELVLSSAAGTSTVFPLRTLGLTLTSAGAGTSTAYPSNVPATLLLTSSATSASSVTIQLDAESFLTATAEIVSGVWFKDPSRVAWLMNTETAAASWYDNFDFESIAQTTDKVLAIGPDGLYELTGATDSDEEIDAYVQSGFMDFGTSQTKRVDAMYFGYTSDATITVTVEVYESGHAPVTYTLEERVATAPRNSRIVPGKGLWGRYWRTKIENVDGSDFEVHDASVDIAVSNRKV